MKKCSPLKELASFSKGEQINGDSLVDDGAYAYLNGGIQPSGNWTAYNTPANTVTISEGGNSCGFVNYMKTPFWCGAHCYYLYDTKLKPKYLYYALKSQQPRLMALRSGACMPNIKKKALGEFEVTYDSDQRQQELAISILERVEALLNHRAIELQKLDELVKARFVEMFGDPVSNPKGWEKRALSEEAEISIGPFGSILHKDDYVTNAHPLVNPSHIIDGKIVPDENLTVSNEKYAELAAYHLQKGDVVMGRRGEMGRCAVVERSGLLCGTGSLIIRTKGDLSADYIQKILSFPSFKRTIEAMAVGQTMPNLNVPIVSAFQIIKPPKTVQHSYYQFVARIDKAKATILQAITETQLLFDSLMQKFFREA